MEIPAISLGLFHPLRKTDLLAALALDMYSRQSREVWNLTKRQGTAALDVVPVFTENGGELSFTVCAFAL